MNDKIPGIKTYRKGDKVYAYHRATGKRLQSDPADRRALLAEVEALDRTAAAPKPSNIGTLGHLIEQYRRSPEFVNLAPRTRADYQKVFDYLKPAASTMIADITPGEVKRSRDDAFLKRRRHFANYMLTVLKLLFTWGAGSDLCDRNPAASIKRIRRPRQMSAANRPWDDDECEAVLGSATGGLKLAIALGMFAGMRVGDAIGVTRAAYDGAWVRWSQNKTGDLVELPADARLKALLDDALATIDRQVVVSMAPQLVRTGRGQAYTADGFRTVFFRLIKRLEKKQAVRPGLTFHGLRHTAGRNLTNLGADPAMVAALLGHRTLAMSWHYSKEFDRRRLAEAAVVKLSSRAKTKA